MKKIPFYKFPPSNPIIKSEIILKKSKINVVMIVFFCVLISSVLSGCIESPDTNGNITTIDKVKILSYDVTTEWSSGCKCDNTWEEHVEPGFYHTTYLGYGATYIIRGKIINIAEKKMEAININVNFLAKNGTVLFDAELLNATYWIYNLSKGDNKSFLIEVKPELLNYFDDPYFYNRTREKFLIVESLEFDISAW